MKFLPPSLEAKLLERLLGLFGCGLSSWFPLGRGLFSLSIRPYLCLSHTLVGYVQAQFTAQRLGPPLSPKLCLLGLDLKGGL